MDKYILLADPNPEILKLEVTALRYFYGSEVKTAETTSEVLQILKTRGRPELLIMDLELIRAEKGLFNSILEDLQYNFPVIASSDDPDAHPLIKQFPLVTGILEKPLSVDSFTFLVKALISTRAESPSHVPIDIKTVLNLACKNFDLYLKLSGTNYVKIISKDDVFSYLDARKLMDKGIKDLHILSSDAYNLLRSWEKELKRPDLGNSNDSSGKIVLAIETLESVERIGRAMNWSKDIILSADRTVSAAIEIMSTDDQLVKILKKKLSNKTSPYGRHVGLLCFLCCAFSTHLKWTGDSRQLKLVMAALLHDLAVDDFYYEDIAKWNKRASDFRDKAAEVIRYRLHPIHGSELVQSIDVLPLDVDQIILQHHEIHNGSGFPYSLTSSQIGPLVAMFIMMEDLVEFLGEGENLETSLTDYITWGQAFYDDGHFLKIFEQIRSKIIRF